MLKKVETVRTTYTKDQLVQGLVDGWTQQFGQLPSKESIGVIYAQWSLETGQGASCWCNNLGNVKAVDDPNKEIEYCALNGVWEIVNGKKVILSPDDPGAWFRAFPTLADGVAFHLDFLKNHRYKSAWTAVDSGNPAAFGHLLKLFGYYTAPEADYVKLMNYYFALYMKSGMYENSVNNVPEQSSWNKITDTFKNFFK